MINSNIITDIDNAIIESEMCVIESMINSYHKALMILEHSESSDYYDIIQESSSGDNIIVKMFKAIIEFFKRIGKSISSFFNKSKETITTRLRKFDKDVDSNADYTETQNKIDNISESKSESINNKIKDELVDEKQKTSESKTKDKKSGINIKERKIKTRIIFKNWIAYLKDLESLLDDFINNDIETKKQKMAHRCYSIFSHKYPASEVADYVDEIVKLLKTVNIKTDEAITKISKIQQAFNEELSKIKKIDKLSYNENKKYMVDVVGMASMIEACHVDIVSMASELASELDLYGIILDVIEPVLKKHKDADDKAKSEEKAKMEAEEAKRIEQEKEANTQRIEIVHKKA